MGLANAISSPFALRRATKREGELGGRHRSSYASGSSVTTCWPAMRPEVVGPAERWAAAGVHLALEATDHVAHRVQARVTSPNTLSIWVIGVHVNTAS